MMIHWSFLGIFALQFLLVNCGHSRSNVMTTSGGHCVLPFTYRGVLYKSCTTKNHHRPWCSTTANYDREKTWGNCAGFSSSGVKTTSREYCVFPFIYKKKLIHSCTSENRTYPWCSTTANFDKDQKSGKCAGFLASRLKTASGRYCVFPFTHKGVAYRSCTTKDYNRPWCGMTAKYNKDREADICAGFYSNGVNTTNGEYCAFPFIYKGRHYSTCTRTWLYNRRWCSVTTNYDQDKKWGYCA